MLSIATRKGPSEVRDELIRQFIRNWRKRVGNDIYPVFRLVMPQLDKERAMYGLKESALGKVLVKVLNINVTSPDAVALSKWKSGSVYSAGNFAQRCYEILIKRDTKTTFGNLTIGDVNEFLDKLCTDKEQHIPVITQLVHSTNAEEMSWIVRIILRSVRMGASEKRFFNLWHPDAESLYSVTSDLKRVSWQLWDPTYRLPSNENQISLMSCFQPQLASFRRHAYDKLDDIIRDNMPSGKFFIEEKMDGERIQIHYADRGKQVRFFSRKIKDYSYLYGTYAGDNNGSITKYLKGVINDKVVNCIIDGEMVAWDDNEGGIAPFGTLKTAAAGDIQHMHPMFLAFDIVYLNAKSLVEYPLKERKAALEKIITPKAHHFEVLPYTVSSSSAELSRTFRRVIEEA
jgi:DNA ligase-4